jgi:hypothetical protein
MWSLQMVGAITPALRLNFSAAAIVVQALR